MTEDLTRLALGIFQPPRRARPRAPSVTGGSPHRFDHRIVDPHQVRAARMCSTVVWTLPLPRGQRVVTTTLSMWASISGGLRGRTAAMQVRRGGSSFMVTRLPLCKPMPLVAPARAEFVVGHAPLKGRPSLASVVIGAPPPCRDQHAVPTLAPRQASRPVHCAGGRTDGRANGRLQTLCVSASAIAVVSARVNVQTA